MRRLATSTVTVVLLSACASPGGYSLTKAPPKAGDPPPSLSSAAPAFTVSGQVEVSAQSPGRRGSQPCVPDNGPYEDLTAQGAAVTVVDSSERAIALGRLGEATYRDVRGKGSQSGICVFTFTVADVPEGARVYRVTVGSRIPVTYTRDELNSRLTLSPGDF